MREYHKHMPISPPEEDWDDRNLLYAMYVLPRTYNLVCGILLTSPFLS